MSALGQFLPFTAILAQRRLLSGKRTYRDLARGIRPPRQRRHFIRNNSSIPQNCDARKWAMVVTMNNVLTFVELVALTLIVMTLIGLLLKGRD
jgi:hypothetical protein